MQTDDTHFKFSSTQLELGASILVYEVKIVSSSFSAVSPPSTFTVKLASCGKVTDWVIAQNPTQNVNYDVRNPPASSILATRNYLGPLLSACGNPVLTLKD